MKISILKLRIGQYISFLLCLMLMVVIPISRDHKIFGKEIKTDEEKENIETVRSDDKGNIIINTTELGKDIMGYGGPTPVEIIINNGRIQNVVSLPNQETPEFFGAIRNSDMLESLNGLSLAEALDKRIDGVTGATYSSKSLAANMKAGIEYALKADNIQVVVQSQKEELPLKFYITIVIILAGGIVPFFIKDKRYRTLQLILNVLLLGFWGGTFISYSLMVSYLTNGITQVVLIPTVLLLITAFIYPFFGKKNYYCAWICPYGSLQELLGKIVKKKIPVNGKWIKGLNIFRELLWFVLMWLLWTGLWFDWMGYEPFAAFFITDASPVVLGIAGGFLVLSLFIQRPYCRFICPTGSLFKFAEGSASSVSL